MGWSRRCGWGLAFVLWTLPAYGDGASDAVRTARKRFAEGVAAADAGNYEAARLAFQQAYALKPHPSALRNLGEAELMTGRYLDAVRHLTEFVRDTTFGSPQDREHAKKALLRAQAKVARLLVDVDVADADITVDGESIARSPAMAEPVYVEAGRRIVRIQKEGYQLYEQAEVLEPGRTTHLRITLKPNVVERPLDETRSPSSLSKPTSGNAPAAAAVEGASAASQGGAPHNAARATVMLTTGALTAASAAVWIGFAVRSASLGDRVTELRDQLGPQASCTNASGACEELHDVAERRVTSTKFAIAGAVGTAVFGAAFVGAWRFWPSPPASGMTLRPDFGLGRAGLLVHGSF